MYNVSRYTLVRAHINEKVKIDFYFYVLIGNKKITFNIYIYIYIYIYINFHFFIIIHMSNLVIDSRGLVSTN